MVEDVRERPRDHLRADGDAAGFVVGLGTVRDVAVPLHNMLLRLDVGSESERARGDGDGTPYPRASRNLWWRTHECGTATICARTGTLLSVLSA